MIALVIFLAFVVLSVSLLICYVGVLIKRISKRVDIVDEIIREEADCFGVNYQSQKNCDFCNNSSVVFYQTKKGTRVFSCLHCLEKAKEAAESFVEQPFLDEDFERAFREVDSRW